MATMCISCGMPMEKPEHHAMCETGKDYCVYCSRPDGSMKSYEEALADMTRLTIEQEGLDEKEARAKVAASLAQLPAWKNR